MTNSAFFAFQKTMRAKMMPTEDGLAAEAQKRVGISEKDLTKRFNDNLKKLLTIEFELYKQKEKECSAVIIHEAFTKGLLRTKSDIADTFTENYQEFFEFFKSIGQSRMSRAGGSFEKHISVLFEKLGYPFDRQTVLNGKVDYLIPSEKAFRKSRTACVVISIKRTLRERWRQVVGELSSTKAGRIYLITADENISPDKVDEMAKSNVILVVWDEIKQLKFKKKGTVIGFSEFVNDDLPATKSFWKRLI